MSKKIICNACNNTRRIDEKDYVVLNGNNVDVRSFRNILNMYFNNPERLVDKNFETSYRCDRCQIRGQCDQRVFINNLHEDQYPSQFALLFNVFRHEGGVKYSIF